MKAVTWMTSAAAMPTWMPLLFLLTGSLPNSASSETTTVVSAIDISGGIENLSLSAADSTKKMPLHLANAQLDWLVSEGGSVNSEKIAIRQASGDSNNLGIFAVDDIDQGDVLLTIPVSFVLTSST